MKKNLIAITALYFLTSCTWVGTQKQVQIFNKDNPVNTQSSFYLLYPKNGYYKTFLTKKLKENKKSSKEVVDTFRSQLTEKLGELTISESNSSLDKAFKNAKDNGSQYLITITINQWKDAYYAACRAHTNHHGRTSSPPTQDTVDLTVFIYNVKTKALLNKQKIENKGCPVVIAGLIPIGKNSPEARLSPMIQEWLENIK